MGEWRGSCRFRWIRRCRTSVRSRGRRYLSLTLSVVENTGVVIFGDPFAVLIGSLNTESHESAAPAFILLQHSPDAGNGVALQGRGEPADLTLGKGSLPAGLFGAL